MTDLLAIHWHVDPAIFHIGNFQLRWYSVLFVSGFILGWYIMKWIFKREKVSLNLLDPLLYTLLIATIVGARLGHCLFYDFHYYFGTWKGFAEVFMPWKGGLASHGGTIAIILALIWFCRKYGPKNGGIDFWWLTDRLVIPVSFAACCIRLGNIFNSEIYGDPTNLPWGFIFELRGETVPKHPTGLYEALTYLVLGFVLLYLYKHHIKKFKRGQLLGIFLTVCFGMRFLIEFVKEEDVLFFNNTLNTGQVLSIPFIIGGILIIFLCGKYGKSQELNFSTPPKKNR